MVSSISSVTAVSILQITRSGFNTVKLFENLVMSPALNASWPLTITNIFSASPESPVFFKRTCFRFRMISVTSSTTPLMVENSCVTPEKRTEVIAKPSKDESKIRRKALPIVIPKPGSNGRNSNVPSKSVAFCMITLSGF